VQNREEWFRLCEQAAVETDARKMLELISEINGRLLAKKNRLDGQSDFSGYGFSFVRKLFTRVFGRTNGVGPSRTDWRPSKIT